MSQTLTLTACLIVLGLNLVVLGFSLKLYTEILKDQSQNRRAANKEQPHDPR